MLKHCFSLKSSRHILSILALILLLSVCMGQARRINRDASHPPWGMLYYEPSLLFALNKGLVSLDQDGACPEVFSFLRGDLTTFDPALLPDDVATKAPDATVNEHWYLFATLGIFWRLFGLTHDAAWLMQYLFLCIAPCVFSVFAVYPWDACSACLWLVPLS